MSAVDAALVIQRYQRFAQKAMTPQARARERKRLEQKIIREGKKILREVAAEAEHQIRTARYISGSEPSRRTRLQPALDKLRDLRKLLAEVNIEAAQQGRRVTQLHLADQPNVKVVRKDREIRMAIEEFSPRVATLIGEAAFVASEQTMETIVGHVMGSLQTSYEAGVGTHEAAAALRETFTGLEDWKLRQIARTEVNRAQNEGAERTLRELGIRFQQWWATQDGRTRESHLAMHEQIVRVGQPFENGLMYPSEVNCRCRLVPWFPPSTEAVIPATGWFYESDIR